jgi:hypothetical protein
MPAKTERYRFVRWEIVDEGSEAGDEGRTVGQRPR